MRIPLTPISFGIIALCSIQAELFSTPDRMLTPDHKLNK